MSAVHRGSFVQPHVSIAHHPTSELLTTLCCLSPLSGQCCSLASICFMHGYNYMPKHTCRCKSMGKFVIRVWAILLVPLSLCAHVTVCVFMCRHVYVYEYGCFMYGHTCPYCICMYVIYMPIYSAVGIPSVSNCAI